MFCHTFRNLELVGTDINCISLRLLMLRNQNFLEYVFDPVDLSLSAHHFLFVFTLFFLAIDGVYQVFVVVTLFILDLPPWRRVPLFQRVRVSFF